ncbi:hypothetical protein HOY80DRAFT_477800 [Tuber brumale]|nr:hypothetical protein HOY80DRAFT_477800 [Tuber brumale]
MNRNGEIIFRRGRIPPVDVDDALQYTPLSSVVPSTSEIIPLPLLLPNGIGPIFQSEAERRSSRQTLDALDREASADPNSKFVRKTLHELAVAISAPGGTEFRFKSFVTTEDPTTPKEPVTSNILKHQAVGKFGEMVMNRSNVSFKCTKPFRFFSE